MVAIIQRRGEYGVTEKGRARWEDQAWGWASTFRAN